MDSSSKGQNTAADQDKTGRLRYRTEVRGGVGNADLVIGQREVGDIRGALIEAEINSAIYAVLTEAESSGYATRSGLPILSHTAMVVGVSLSGGT